MKFNKDRDFERVDFEDWFPVRATYVFNVKKDDWPYINEAIEALNRGW